MADRATSSASARVAAAARARMAAEAASGRIGRRRRRGESAYPHRSATYNVSMNAFWNDPSLDAEAIGWARSTREAMTPFSTGGVYVNSSGLDDEAGDRRAAVLDASQARLEQLRSDYDPDGLFAAAA